MESILVSIKKILGINADYEHFDPDLIIHINSVFMILNQLGVGPPEGFTITDSSSTWSDFVSDTTKIESIKTYIALKVRLVFDPPQSSAVLSSMERTVSELEWRLNVAVDPSNET